MASKHRKLEETAGFFAPFKVIQPIASLANSRQSDLEHYVRESRRQRDGVSVATVLGFL